MNFSIQKTEELYPLLTDWWKGWDWAQVPRDMLPEYVLVVSGTAPLCAAFLYTSNSKITWLEYVISDPKSEKQERAKGLEELLRGSVDTAKALGASYIFHSTKHPKLIEKLKSLNFTEMENNMTNLWARVN